jgi:hypothetical protein
MLKKKAALKEYLNRFDQRIVHLIKKEEKEAVFTLGRNLIFLEDSNRLKIFEIMFNLQLREFLMQKTEGLIASSQEEKRERERVRREKERRRVEEITDLRANAMGTVKKGFRLEETATPRTAQGYNTQYSFTNIRSFNGLRKSVRAFPLFDLYVKLEDEYKQQKLQVNMLMMSGVGESKLIRSSTNKKAPVVKQVTQDREYAEKLGKMSAFSKMGEKIKQAQQVFVFQIEDGFIDLMIYRLIEYFKENPV